MTVRDFVVWATGYYGPYPAGQRSDIAEYLGYLTPVQLDEMKAQMRASCPSHIGQVNGYPPDIEAMERLLPEVLRVTRAREREARELAYAARMLPAPEDQVTTSEELMAIDWAAIFREATTGRQT